MKAQSAPSCDERGQRRLGLHRVARRDHDLGPGGGEPTRHAEPDAAIAAGDDCDAPGKVEQGHLMANPIAVNRVEESERSYDPSPLPASEETGTAQ